MPNSTQPVDIEVYSRHNDLLGEGPLWSTREQALYWIDIGAKRLHRKGPADAQRKSWSLSDHPGCIAELTPGYMGIAMGAGLQRLNLTTGATELLRAIPAGRSGTRFNDGKVDPQGRLWVSTMQNNFGPNGESIPIERTDGALYRFDADGAVRVMEENIGIGNTLAWSPDLGRFYFADSLRGQIYVYDFDADSGVPRNKRLFFEAPDLGVPDGSAIDVDGCLWNARWDGSALLRITPDGKLDRTLPFPVPRVTSCAFGGPNLDTLYVTTAATGLTDEQLKQFPLSGSIFAIHGVGRGMPVPAMAVQPRG